VCNDFSLPLIAIATVELTHFGNARPNSMLERAIVKAVLSVCPGSDLPEGGWGLNPPPQRIFWPSQSMSVWAPGGSILTPPVHTVIGCHLSHMARVILSRSKCLMADFFYRSSRFKLHNYDENSFLWISETGMFKWDDNMHAVLVNMILLELCQWFPALLLNN